MTTARQLYALQELDLALDQIDGQKAGAEAELDAGLAVAQIESALQAQTERLQEVQSEFQTQQLEAENHRERSAQLDSQLYGGALTNPRDLQSLEQEASHAKDQAQEWEAQLLELSSNQEEVQARCHALEKELADAQAAWELRSQNSTSNSDGSTRTGRA